MTNKKAIKIINAVKFILDDEQYSDEVEEALNMAIKALESVTINADPNEIKVTSCNDNDLISRQAAIDALISEGRNVDSRYLESERIIHESDAVEAIAMMPSAQPEIIRCKDCEHWDTSWQNDYAPNYHYCPLVDGTRRDDFYCADAERRGEQDE